MDNPAETKYQIAFYAVEYLSPIILALVGVLSAKLIAWIHTKTKNELVRGILVELTETITTMVSDTEQTVVAEIKAGRGPKTPCGDKLTKAEAETVKKAALAKIKDAYSPARLAELKKVLKLDDPAVQNLIASKIEEAVLSMKRG